MLKIGDLVRIDIMGGPDEYGKIAFVDSPFEGMIDVKVLSGEYKENTYVIEKKHLTLLTKDEFKAYQVIDA